ncbi:hypothetical protein A3715_31475 [Oleiphilus sp. HI0009]|nr:hypothetical protein A3715_10545 [Oleiphilus sp. HI0009]KZX83683.1 hypothetical protein A3715_31475 [Oleiphilus sp. HI0009]
MSLLEKDVDLIAFKDALKELKSDLNKQIVTDENEEIIHESLMRRVNTLPYTNFFKSKDLMPFISSGYADEIAQINSNLNTTIDRINSAIDSKVD